MIGAPAPSDPSVGISLPPVSLNHVYVVADSATYQAIHADAFMRHALAPSEERTTVRTDQTYTGLYFYGVHTYFELFDVARTAGGRVGDYGVAFGVEQVDGTAALETALGAALLRTPELVTRAFEGRQVPWFWMAMLTHFPLRAPQSAWVMEYRPSFLQEWYPRPGGQGAPSTRRAVLARYRDVLPDRVAEPLLADITAVTIDATAETRERLAAFCTAVGYHRTDRPDGALELRGPDVVLHLAPVARASDQGLRALRCRTHRTPDGPPERRVGRARLTFAEGTATLAFAP